MIYQLIPTYSIQPTMFSLFNFGLYLFFILFFFVARRAMYMSRHSLVEKVILINFIFIFSNLLLYSDTLIKLYIFIEFIGFAILFLIMITLLKHRMEIALKYFFISSISSLCLLIGFLLIY
jgi:NADH:ubiquinone oxidoreductase subunit 2 (subunit N)